MGLLDWLKKPGQNEANVSTALEVTMPHRSSPSGFKVPQAERIVSIVKAPLYKETGTIQLQIEDYVGWYELFVTGKITEKLPGFDLRSKRKVKLHYHSANCFIIGANRTIYIIRPNNSKIISLEHPVIEEMHIKEANDRCAILSSENLLACLDFSNGLIRLFQFSWHPFKAAIGNEFWLVSTRETTEGPGELYCFSLAEEYLWGLHFEEEFDTLFGLIKATAYHLYISEDDTQIIVSTMDRVYHFNRNGILISRIALADLREAEIKMKEAESRANLPKNPQTKELIKVLSHEMAEKMVAGMNRAAALNTPLAGFIFDHLTKKVFIFENNGRLTAWNSTGDLLWVYSFNESGNYIGLSDNAIAISLRSGDIFWLDKQGKTLFSAKLPKQAKSVFAIPDQEKYLIVCEDGRRYELDKQTGELIQGPEGDRNMKLFMFQDRIIFYDGYLWAAPSGFSWQTYQPKKVTQAASMEELSSQDFAPQVKISKPFKKIWTFSNPNSEPIHHYAIDKRHKRIYVGRRKAELSPEEKELQDKSFEANCFARWNDIYCYDFSLKLLWSNSFLSEITSLAVSPEGDAVFVGLWGDGLAYDPGKLVVLDINGKEKLAVTTASNPGPFSFEAPCKGMMKVFQGPPYMVRCTNQGNWKIEQDSIASDSKTSEESGLGLDSVILGNYRIIKLGKKNYQVCYKEVCHDLKTNAAIYDAILIPDSENLLLKIGNKTVREISPDMETLWEIKTKGNIKSLTTGGGGFLIISKEEIVFHNSQGFARWKFGCPPNPEYNNAAWLNKHDAFLWWAGDREYYQVALISTDGQIKISQLFKGFSRFSAYPHMDVLDDESCFVLPINDHLECYEII
jgi:outer membrane protein assembly factor BamB